MNRILIVIICFLFSMQLHAQNVPKGILYFDHLIEYQFIDVDGVKSDMQFLLNTKNGTLGFDKNMTNADGWGEDLEFIVADPMGNFYFFGTDPEKGKIITRQFLKETNPSTAEKARFKKIFSSRFYTHGKIQKSNGLSVQEFRSKPEADGSFEKVSVAPVQFNTYSLYLFNALNGDVKLNCGDRLNYSGTLAPNQLLISSFLVFPKEKLSSSLKLTYYTPTEYYFDTNGFKMPLTKK